MIYHFLNLYFKSISLFANIILILKRVVSLLSDRCSFSGATKLVIIGKIISINRIDFRSLKEPSPAKRINFRALAIQI